MIVDVRLYDHTTRPETRDVEMRNRNREWEIGIGNGNGNGNQKNGFLSGSFEGVWGWVLGTGRWITYLRIYEMI